MGSTIRVLAVRDRPGGAVSSRQNWTASLSTETIRVLLADSHDMFVESLSWVLRDVYGMEVAGTARLHAGAVELAERLKPSVAMVDSVFPDGNGILTAAAIREVSPDTRVIVVCDTPDPRLARSAIDVGCSGFLTKDKGIRELVSAINHAHNGNAYLAPELLAAVLPQYNSGQRGIGSDLTVREREVLELLAAGGLGNKDLAAKMSVSLHTVRNHVQSILAKLGAHSKLEAVVIAAREGLLDRPRQGV
jgi:DNA-binding NarL/FixJ family response regulator